MFIFIISLVIFLEGTKLKKKSKKSKIKYKNQIKNLHLNIIIFLLILSHTQILWNYLKLLWLEKK